LLNERVRVGGKRVRRGEAEAEAAGGVQGHGVNRRRAGRQGLRGERQRAAVHRSSRGVIHRESAGQQQRAIEYTIEDLGDEPRPHGSTVPQGYSGDLAEVLRRYARR